MPTLYQDRFHELDETQAGGDVFGQAAIQKTQSLQLHAEQVYRSLCLPAVGRDLLQVPQ
jgi:hypothetical protein